MADYCTQYTLGSIKINDTTAGANRLMIGTEGEITGLDGAPVRSQVDNLGQTSGGIVFPKFLGPRVITFSGEVHIQSVDWTANNTAWLTAVNTLESGVVTALEGMLNSATTLSWTPTGGSGKSISVTYGVPGQEIQFSGAMVPGERKFSFSVIAAIPTIS